MGLARGINEKNVSEIGPFLGKSVHECEGGAGGGREVLALLKPVRNEQLGCLSVLRMPVRIIRSSQVLADTTANILYSYVLRISGRTA